MRVVRALGEERRREFGSDLVRPAADARADRGGDAAALRALLRQCRERRLEHAADGAAPAGMRRGDETGLGVGEQHGRAVGGQYPERHARRARHQPIDARPVVIAPRALDQRHVGAVDLVAGDELLRREAEAGERAAAVLGDESPGRRPSRGCN